MSTNKYYLEKKKSYDAQKREVLSTIKLLKGCEICGFNGSPQALTFDHIDPETKEIPIADYSQHSWKKLLTEITKCRVLCANCHNSHSQEQAHNGVDPAPLTQRTLDLIKDILGIPASAFT